MAAIDFPDPSALNPETGEQYGNGWYNASNGVTYVYSNNTWSAATVNNANFDDLYVNEEGGDHMEGPLTVGPDADPANAVIKIGSTALGDGDIQVGGDALAQAGVNIYDNGSIISTASSNTEIFRGYLTGGTGDTVEIRSTGDATFAGDVEAGGDVQMASQNGGPLAGFRNHLINGDFRIWQRGTTGLTNTNTFYGADRWVSGANNTISRSGTAPVGFAFSARIQYGGTATEGYIGQPIELDNANRQSPVRPGTYTLSWYSNNNTTNAIARWRVTGTSDTGQINAPDFSAVQEIEAADTNGFARYACQITIPVTALTGGITSFYVAVRSNSTDFRVAGVMFEPGPVATPFEHRPISTELALCKRYFQTIKLNTYDTMLFRGSGSTSLTAVLNFPVEMRDIPAGNSVTGLTLDHFPGFGVTRENATTNGTMSLIGRYPSGYQISQNGRTTIDQVFAIQVANNVVFTADAEL